MRGEAAALSCRCTTHPFAKLFQLHLAKAFEVLRFLHLNTRQLRLRLLPCWLSGVGVARSNSRWREQGYCTAYRELISLRASAMEPTGGWPFRSSSICSLR
jgi:hypothetical protein